MTLRYFDGAEIRSRLSWSDAVDALRAALRSDVNPEEDSPRIFAPAAEGEFLIMPASGSRYCGVKALTVAPANPSRGLDKIQGVYVLYDSDTLAPVAAMDGTELTAVRTPAVTLLAIVEIIAAQPTQPTSPPFVLVYGSGVQALNHIRAAHSLLDGATFGVIGRTQSRVTDMCRTLAAEGIAVSECDDSALESADIIICATTSTTPVFDGRRVASGAIVAAIGQHGLDAREVDAHLVLRSDVVVEGRASALREAGDLIPARSAEEWVELAPANLQDMSCGRFRRSATAPCLYAGVGMAWEDLVIASAVYGEEHHE